jgi:hypothetical protein
VHTKRMCTYNTNTKRMEESQACVHCKCTLCTGCVTFTQCTTSRTLFQYSNLVEPLGIAVNKTQAYLRGKRTLLCLAGTSQAPTFVASASTIRAATVDLW